ncbi:MAG TPA: hypothetical protein PKD85_17620, partial [Saprospiraceae bacterium]|nr:hypothetical protein [Saprospiraceae bacterium]
STFYTELNQTKYILKKIKDEKELRLLLLNLLDYINIIPVTDKIIIKGLKSDDKDFEDAIQMQCAYTFEEMDCIITRNIKDFKKANISVYT